jgi:hypothetical protein
MTLEEGMKIFERIVMDWDGNTIEEQSFDYEGPVALCGGGGGGKKPKTPEVPPPAPKPATGKDMTAAATEAEGDQKNRARRYLGQQGTILTSPMGSAPQQQQGKQLLGQ